MGKLIDGDDGLPAEEVGVWAKEKHDCLYGIANDGLKAQEEMTFSDEEIDKFLPATLRRASPAAQQAK